MSGTSRLRAALRWLRAGYPDRAPGPDRVPLLALLVSARLTGDQIDEVVRNITASTGLADGKIGRGEIAELIKALTHQEPTDDDITRVARRLAAGGWPLAGKDDA